MNYYLKGVLRQIVVGQTCLYTGHSRGKLHMLPSFQPRSKWAAQLYSVIYRGLSLCLQPNVSYFCTKTWSWFPQASDAEDGGLDDNVVVVELQGHKQILMMINSQSGLQCRQQQIEHLKEGMHSKPAKHGG